MAVYRAPMRSRRHDVAPLAAVARALELGLCGFGGVLRPPPAELAAAVVAAERQHDVRLARRIERFASVTAGSFAWTRDGGDRYWLGRIDGPYFYDGRAGAETVDLVHVRACKWLVSAVPDGDVPAAVIATFGRGGRNFQQTHAPGVDSESLRVWNQRTEFSR
jgi:hypothetical protein